MCEKGKEAVETVEAEYEGEGLAEPSLRVVQREWGFEHTVLKLEETADKCL